MANTLMEKPTMTEDQCVDKVLKIWDAAREMVEEVARKKYRSGAVDPSEYDNNYRLPKIILASVLEEIKWQYRPLDGDDKIVRNLNKF